MFVGMPSISATYRNKRVLVTGHTGFKGSWLCEWLCELGAEVYGFALPPPTTPSLFEQLDIADRVARHCIGDVRDLEVLRTYLKEVQPEFIFHLAAQPLVRMSFRYPVETYAVNVMGTVNLLESVRTLEKPCAVVVVTTDKCYENREWLHAYRESDPMGGYDPYSSSKGAAELVISAYQRSFFSDTSGIHLASARAGNVIGGGDWAHDRIVPDCIRSLQRGATIQVRNKNATRPWQHVLEPLSGYLELGQALRMGRGPLSARAYVGAFNFGPNLDSNQTVGTLVEEILRHWPGSWEDHTDPDAPHEASKLNLSADKAFHLLGWKPRWSFQESIQKTVSWYSINRNNEKSSDFRGATLQQIRDYCDSSPSK
jgi:CDP-glucose 4,6-dehydratase